MSMKCQKCKKGRTVVIDSRTSGNSIRRRRKCLKCGHRFSTFEVLKEAKRLNDKIKEEYYKKPSKEKIKVAKETEKKVIEEKIDDGDDFDLDEDW